MRKGILFVILGSLVWFFFIATPSQKASIEKLFLGSENVVRLTQKAGEPVSPTVIQKLYKPHGLDEDR